MHTHLCPPMGGRPHTEPLLYGSVCSGIEAVSLAWQPLGFEAAWFAEIEPFPSAVLAHRYPHVPNLGDMTAIARQVCADTVPAPDILVGGAPYQSFSVAGARQGLNDPRGALTLAYVELANAIDQTRQQDRRPAPTLVWENVPGVLNDRSNAFGHFLDALAGESRALQPPGAKWAHAGCVSGPRRRIAWRVLDAQYFGVAQRRKRVFLVASGGDDLDPTEVLFERAGLLGDSGAGYAPWQEAARAVGSTFLHTLNGKAALLTQAEAFAKGLPPAPLDIGQDEAPHLIDITLDFLVDELADALHAERKGRAAFNRDFGNKVLFIKDGKLLFIKGIKLKAIADRKAHFASLRTPQAQPIVILAELAPDEAFALWKQHVLGDKSD